jgi:hypothetical protein
MYNKVKYPMITVCRPSSLIDLFRFFPPFFILEIHLKTIKMGIDAGFDMVPRLSRGAVDVQLWPRFIYAVKEYYKDDAQVEMTSNYIEFKVGEHPLLPYEGYKFLRFSSKVSGSCGAALSYIDTVARAAKAIFGTRIQYWNECFDEFGHYDWREVHKSIDSYNEVSRLSSHSD